MASRSRTFRIFVSSTSSDMIAERNALQLYVFPKLRDLCNEQECRFQAIDLRWGVSDDASNDNRATDVCLSEIDRCQAVTPKPNFIVLLGDRYGYTAVPSRIPEDEMNRIKAEIRKSDPENKNGQLKLIDYDESKPDDLTNGWYRKDLNADPPEYCLQPRDGKYLDYKDKIREVLLKAARSAGFDEEQIRKYERSITEHECNHGAFKAEKGHTFCYFRTIVNRDAIDESRRKDFFDTDPDSIRLLNNLKARLKAEIPEEQIFSYDVKGENATAINPQDGKEYQSMALADLRLQKFCDRVEQDLTRVILAKIKTMESLTPLQKENEDHNDFRIDRVKGFLGRVKIIDEIENYVHNGSNKPRSIIKKIFGKNHHEINHPLVVCGLSGSGKSALIAKCIGNTLDKLDENSIIYRFIGATPSSIDLRMLLESLCDEMESKFGLKSPPRSPDEKTDINTAIFKFNEFLNNIPKNRKLVLFIDALDQLTPDHGAQALNWFPKDIKDNVRIVVSVIKRDESDSAGDCFRTIQKYHKDDKLVELTPLEPEHGKEILLAFLSDAKPSRKIQDNQWDDIIKKFKTHGLPLYLKIAFEEARWWKSYDGLPICIDGNIGIPETTEGAIENLLWRMEDDKNHGETHVCKSLGYIAASRYGLDEDELLRVLANDEEYLKFFRETHHWHKIPKTVEDGKTVPVIPIVVWSRLHFDLKPYISERSRDNVSLFNFYHRQVGEVVAKRYLTEKYKKPFHKKLADFFSKHKSEIRKIPEYPWELCEAEEWRSLFELLSKDLELFHKAWKRDKFDVLHYWASIERASRLKAGEGNEPEFTIVKGYRRAIENPEYIDDSILWYIGFLLGDTGNPKEASIIREYLIRHFDETGDRWNYAYCLGNQGNILYSRGDLDGAMALYKKQQRICEELGDKAGLQACLGNQGNILYSRGDLDGAMALHKEQQRICEELGDKAGLSRSLAGQGLILWSRGDLDGAMALYIQQQRICEELGDKAGLSISLGNQGNILYSRGDLDGAMVLYQQQQRICEELGDKAGLSRSLAGQGVILYTRGDLDGAMALYKQQQRICEELGDKAGLSGSLGNQGNILAQKGDLDGAMALYKQQQRICEELGDKAGLQISLGNQGIILKARGDLDGAMALHKKEQRICEELGDPNGLAIVLINQASCLSKMGEVKEAITKAEEAYQTALKHGYNALAGQMKQTLNKIRSQQK